MKVSGNTAVLEFDCPEGGLASKDGQPLTWFRIAGTDKKFVPAEAKNVGTTLEVSSAQVDKPLSLSFCVGRNSTTEFL